MKIDVPSAAFRSGSLLELGICARHGVPATRARTRRFTTEPPGIVVLVAFCSLFLVLLVAAAFQKDVRGALPECDRCATTYRRRITAMWIGVVTGPVFLIAALALGLGPVSLVGLAIMLVGIICGVVADVARVRGTLDSELALVQLRGVDRAFAAAVADRVQSAPQLDPWVTPLR